MAASDTAAVEKPAIKHTDAPHKEGERQVPGGSLTTIATGPTEAQILSSPFRRSPTIPTSGTLDIPRSIEGVPGYAREAQQGEPVRTTDGSAPQVRPETRQRFGRWLQGNDAVSEAVKGKLEKTLGYIDRMPERERQLALNGLEQFLKRGDSNHTALPNGDNPRIEDPQIIARTLDNVNSALSAKTLNPMMGAQGEFTRNRAIAEFLSNAGDSRGVKQGHHLTCALDGRIKAEDTERPDITARVLADAMTTQTGTITMPDGRTQVRLNASFMHDDGAHSDNKWAPGAAAQDQSLDVRILTGVYANALTQRKGFNFVMDVASSGESGDRLITNDGKVLAATSDGSLYLTTDTRRGVASPGTNADVAASLESMTGDGQVLATSARAWNGHAGPNLVDVSGPGGMQKLIDLIHQHKIQQVGLSANILFGTGDSGGGHLTNLTGVRTDKDGQVWFHVEDTNVQTSGWVKAERVMAAINNDSSYLTRHPEARTAMRSGEHVEDMPVLHIPQAQRTVATATYRPPRGEIVTHSLPNAESLKEKKAEGQDPLEKKQPQIHKAEDDPRQQKLALAAAYRLALERQQREEEDRRKREEQERKAFIQFAAAQALRISA